MQAVKIQQLNLWQFKILSEVPSVSHFVTDRKSGEANEFTLSYSSSPDREEIKRNRIQLASALSVNESKLFFPSQVHKTKIVQVNAQTSHDDLQETDALITNEPGICIAVMSADCVPVLLFDTVNKAVAAVHSGWRGTVAKIVDKVLLAMQKSFGTKGKDIIACIGPSVCQDSYEVGEEVKAEVIRTFGKDNGLMIEQPDKKVKLDLWKANKIQLME